MNIHRYIREYHLTRRRNNQSQSFAQRRITEKLKFGVIRSFPSSENRSSADFANGLACTFAC